MGLACSKTEAFADALKACNQSWEKEAQMKLISRECQQVVNLPLF